jgi:purine-binding chemotaxis protein CheW
MIGLGKPPDGAAGRTMKPDKRTEMRAFDWEAAKQRLACAAQAIKEAGQLSPERARAVMDERARVLARVPRQELDRSEFLQVLTFGLGTERFAVETRCVREVIRPGEFTTVPGAPDFLVGVTNLRGEVLSVIDLRKFFGVQRTEPSQLARVIVCGETHVEFGVLADVVEEVTTLRIDRILPAPGSVAGAGREYLLGVTEEALAVLDGSALLRDPRLFVDQEEQ